MEGEGWWRATKWQIKGMSELKTAKWHQLVLVLAPHNTKQLTPFPTSPASHVVIYSRLAACPEEMEAI